MNARHAAGYSAWGTPIPYIQASREALGSIDLDPASDAISQARIQALRYFGVELDGLAQSWEPAETVFLNPPGGLVRPFWRKLLHWRASCGPTRRAIWIGYSLEQLQTLQTDGPGPIAMASAICYPNRRIAFLDGAGVPRPGPTHANYIALVGGASFRVASFCSVFTQFGEVQRCGNR